MPDFFLRDSYDYQLPEELIAQYPLPDRTQSRLMTLDRKLRQIGHHKFEEIGVFLREGDLLAVNTSKVFPARLFGKKENGTPIEILLLSEFKPLNWSCLVYPGKRVKKPEMFS
ncbi:MAG: S-adenosylmethionine:tRNA ribosyltransferase-isomerase, partial [Candidatus Cloacimonetes bacterium]|nr:S-adenosylmethionine:tRNA ribosyltransferase-isomerase [Candidatus Cloacimonadota bacterium]